MYAVYVQKGESIDYRPNAAVAAGDVVIQGGLAGIAKLDIPAGALGSLAMTGVFAVTKGNTAFNAGANVYWNATNHVATATTTDTLIGKAVEAAVSGDAAVKVLLNA